MDRLKRRILSSLLAFSMLISSTGLVGYADEPQMGSNATGGGAAAGKESSELTWGLNQQGIRVTIIDMKGKPVSEPVDIVFSKPWQVDELDRGKKVKTAPEYFADHISIWEVQKLMPLLGEHEGGDIPAPMTWGSSTAMGNGDAIREWLMAGAGSFDIFNLGQSIVMGNGYVSAGYENKTAEDIIATLENIMGDVVYKTQADKQKAAADEVNKLLASVTNEKIREAVLNWAYENLNLTTEENKKEATRKEKVELLKAKVDSGDGTNINTILYESQEWHDKHGYSYVDKLRSYNQIVAYVKTKYPNAKFEEVEIEDEDTPQAATVNIEQKSAKEEQETNKQIGLFVVAEAAEEEESETEESSEHTTSTENANIHKMLGAVDGNEYIFKFTGHSNECVADGSNHRSLIIQQNNYRILMEPIVWFRPMGMAMWVYGTVTELCAMDGGTGEIIGYYKPITLQTGALCMTLAENLVSDEKDGGNGLIMQPPKDTSRYPTIEEVTDINKKFGYAMHVYYADDLQPTIPTNWGGKDKRPEPTPDEVTIIKVYEKEPEVIEYEHCKVGRYSIQDEPDTDAGYKVTGWVHSGDKPIKIKSWSDVEKARDIKAEGTEAGAVVSGILFNGVDRFLSYFFAHFGLVDKNRRQYI